MDKQLQAVLLLWFDKPQVDGSVLPEVQARWWKKNPEFDAKIQAEFSSSIERAAQGDFNSELIDPEARLAVIILLDQMSRNAFRDTPKAFAQDHIALRLAQEAVASKQDQALSFSKRAFIYFPFEHAEDKAMQAKSVALFQALHKAVPDQRKAGFKNYIDYAIAHQKIIDRFGHFPHRNKILGRDSTEEEIAFLQTEGSSF